MNKFFAKFFPKKEFLPEGEIPNIKYQAFWNSDDNGDWSVHYADNENSSLMSKDVALSYARMFKAPYIFKAQGRDRGLVIRVDPSTWI